MTQYKLIVDSEPELKWLKLTELYIPAKYQRALAGKSSLSNIDHIKNNFNWAECGALLVCKTRKDSEKYAVIDGQHRFKGAELREDITRLPCIIITPRELKEQAQTFINVNTRRQSLTSLQYYRAALVAGDKAAELLERLCAETGVIIPTYAFQINQIGPDMFQAVGVLMKMLRRGLFTEGQVRYCFEVIRSAFPGEKGAFRFAMVHALLEWAKKYPKIPKEEIIKTLNGTSVHDIDMKSRETYKGQHHRTAWTIYLEIMERMHANRVKSKAA